MLVDEAKLIYSRDSRPKDPLVSCIIPMYNEQDNIVKMLDCLTALFEQNNYRYNFVVVDDGSKDHSVCRVMQALENYPATLVQLSRNFGKEIALTAALDFVDGDVVVMLDADFQHPPEMIPIFIEHWRQGYDMVYGARKNRDQDTWLKKQFTKAFYALVNWGAPIKMPQNTQDFRVLDRSVVDALSQMSERNRFMKGIYNWVGFNQLMIETEVHERQAGESKFNFKSLWGLGLTGLTAFSNAPLRLSMYVGFAVALSSVSYAGFTVLKELLGFDSPDGWPTLAVAITFLGGVQLIAIGILGEYIGRIYDEVKQRPIYLTKMVKRSHKQARQSEEPKQQ